MITFRTRECGEEETRDRMLLYCRLWKEVREEVWKRWWKGLMHKEGWVEMDRMLSEKEGTERVEEFRRTQWMKRNLVMGKVEEREERKEIILRPWEKKGNENLARSSRGGREELRREARGRMRRLRKRWREGVALRGMSPIASDIPPDAPRV